MSRRSRSRVPVVIVVVLLWIGLVGTAGGPTTSPTSTVPRETVETFAQLNQLLEELIQLVSEPGLDTSALAAKLDEAHGLFAGLLTSLPTVYGVPFLDLFNSLYSVGASLDDASLLADQGATGPWAGFGYYLAVDNARREKNLLEWAMTGGRLHVQLSCPNGKALVTVFPGFNCHELRAKLNELLAAGTCVALTWQEPIGYLPDPSVAFGGPTAAQLSECLGTSYPTAPTFELDPQADPDDPTYTEQHTLGDPTGAVHTPQVPTAPHSSYVDSAFALDIVAGEWIRYDASEALEWGDVLKPCLKVKELCRRTNVDWLIYGPEWTLASTYSTTLDPADYRTDCLSSFSTAGWLDIDPTSFAMSGTYTAELWVGGQHSANHTFQVAGADNRPPFVNNDFYAIDEDSVLNAQDQPLTWNDIDPDVDPLIVQLVVSPAHGVADVTEDGRFVYTPNLNYYGVDGFRYEAIDPAGLSRTGDVTILVNPVNDAPTAVDDEFVFSSQDLGPDGTLRIPAPGVLANDVDPDRDVLSMADYTLPEAYTGSVTVSSDGSIVAIVNLAASDALPDDRWTLTAGESVDLFSYNTFDGTAKSNTATVRIRMESE
jgi:hypothetical protein